MLSTKVTVCLAALVAVLCVAETCVAQRVQTVAPTGKAYGNTVKHQDVQTYSVKAEASRSVTGDYFGRSPSSVIGRSTGPTTKPFANASNRPTVSPYLNLLRDDSFDSNAVNYYGLVKPQLNQIQTNQRVQRQGQEIYRQLQALQGRAAFPVQGSENLYPTGHQSVYMNYLHYYRVAAPRR